MDRKSFLKNSALGPAGVALAFSGRAGMANNNTTDISLPDDIKITNLKGYRFKKAHFVKIETNRGVSGWGESDGANRNFSATYLDKAFKDLIVGNYFEFEDGFLKLPDTPGLGLVVNEKKLKNSCRGKSGFLSPE